MAGDDSHGTGNGWSRDEREVRFRLDQYDERIGRLEASMGRLRISLGELRGRILTWSAIIAIVMGSVASASTAWFLKAATERRESQANEQVRVAIEKLLHRLEQADREASR